MQKIPGQRKRTFRYLFDGHIYHEDSKFPNRRYICGSRHQTTGQRCQVSLLKHDDGSIEVQPGKIHHHAPSDINFREPAIRCMQKLARETDLQPMAIISEMSKQHKEVAIQMRYDAAQGIITTERRKNEPKSPETLKELNNIIDKYRWGKEVYLGSFEGADGSFGVVFGSTELLKELSKATEVHGDGTFACRPRDTQSRQVFIMHIRKRNVGIPVLYMLLSHKTKSMYAALWVWLKQQIPEVSQNLKFFISDYEIGLINATREAFPDIRIRGCWIHFIRAVSRKWKALDLPSGTNEAKEVLSCVWAMPLLKSDMFHAAFNIIVNKINNKIPENYKECKELFIDYMRKQWMGLAQIVSVANSPIRTNNVAEGHNKQLPTRFGDRPPVYKFLNKLRDVIRDNEILLQKINNGTHVNTPRHDIQRERNERIRKAQEDLKLNVFGVEDFLLSIFSPTERNYSVKISIELDQYENEDPKELDIPVHYLKDNDDLHLDLETQISLPTEEPTKRGRPRRQPAGSVASRIARGNKANLEKTKERPNENMGAVRARENSRSQGGTGHGRGSRGGRLKGVRGGKNGRGGRGGRGYCGKRTVTNDVTNVEPETTEESNSEASDENCRGKSVRCGRGSRGGRTRRVDNRYRPYQDRRNDEGSPLLSNESISDLESDTSDNSIELTGNSCGLIDSSSAIEAPTIREHQEIDSRGQHDSVDVTELNIENESEKDQEGEDEYDADNWSVVGSDYENYHPMETDVNENNEEVTSGQDKRNIAESKCATCLNNNVKFKFMPCGHICICTVCLMIYKAETKSSILICPECEEDSHEQVEIVSM